MNDETHQSGPGGDPSDNVLRPFTAPAQPPLPPIEPSRVVPEPLIPEEPVVEEMSAEEIIAEAPVPPPPPVAALEDDPLPRPAPPAAEPEVPNETDLTDEAELSDERSDESEPSDEAEHAGPGDTPMVTLPRQTFLVGVGVLVGAILLFAALWRSGGDGGDESAGGTAPAAPETTVSTQPTTSTPPVQDPPDLGVARELEDAHAEIAGLEALVASLEERPPPAIAGSQLRRIVVGADAKFVSALPGSIAVVGAFGGVSLIDPETNRVVANGNVAQAATRVLRTSSSVWLTNYADNQLLRIDPATNTVAAALPFVGPDGIDKDGDTLIVASFDGGYVARVDPNTGALMQQVDVGGKPTDVFVHPDHGLWALVFDTGEAVQIDPATFEIVQRVTVGQGPVGVTADATHLWIANHDEGTVAKVDPATGEVVWTAAVGNGPTEAAVAAGSLWVTVTDDGSLVEVDASSGDLLSITPLGGSSAGGGPTGITESEGSLWIAMQGEQSVVRVELP